ncbi:MAG: multiheme c-type cytochrome [Thermodesulfobacteriota bacterium]
MPFSKAFRRIAMIMAMALPALVAASGPGDTGAAADKRYVGSQTCRACHQKQYQRYEQYAKKARSYDSVRVMEKGLTEAEIRECYECHTTGYGQPGGFVSESNTPQMKNAGCEVCHGPGSRHAETLHPEDIIGDIEMSTCKRCHNSDRVAAFDFKPLKHAGAH